MKYLITGLESSCTRIVSKLIAVNLDIIKDPSEWDGHDSIFDKDNIVTHRSIPHGIENNFINDDFVSMFDFIIISTRDWNCSLLSKVEKHQHNIINANQEHLYGVNLIKYIISKYNNVSIFSSETAFLLQESYTTPFIKSLGIENPKHINFENPNNKYLKEIGI